MESKEQENRIIIKNIYDGVQILTDDILGKIKDYQIHFNKKQKEINYMKSVLDKIRDSKYNNCCICSNDISIYGITKCYHFYCFDCIVQLIKNDNNCAICRNKISNINEIIFFSKNTLNDTTINIKSLDLSNNNRIELTTSTISTDLISDIDLNEDVNILNTFVDETYDLIGLISILFTNFNMEEKLKYSTQMREINNNIKVLFPSADTLN
jgi:hypothetical protein